MLRIHVFMISTLGRIALIAALVLMPAAAAFADFKVKHPDAETGEWEIETVGNYGRSGNPLTDNEQSFVHEIEHGVSDWWRTGLEFETNREAGPGNHLKFDALTWENWLVFGERGQYWLDAALFAEYSHGMLQSSPDEVTFGPLLRKQIGPTINTVNLFLTREIGSFAENGRMSFSYAWETRFATGWPVEPGFQAYGEPGPFGHFAPISTQDHRIGPQLFTRISNIGPGSLKMNGGVLFGLTPAAPRQTFRWQLEYELHF
jgi:hypothetical protein